MPAYANASSYTPLDYSVGTHAFWGALLDDHWIPSPVFCRLIDSLFLYANENCNIPSLRNDGKMEFSKILYVRSAVAGEAAIAKLPYTIWALLYRAMWDNDGVGYSLITDADGCEHPILDRTNWLTSSVRDAQYDPDGEHRAWNKIVMAFKLNDPQTGLPFPTPIPRISFPLSGLKQSKVSRDRAVNQFLGGLVLEHTQAHIQYARLSTNSGAVNCDKCGKAIHGIRYKCKECSDFDECGTCFHNAILNASPPISPEGNAHQMWHKVQRLSISPGSRVCDVCQRSNMSQINHCLNCVDYDECDMCLRARGRTSVPLSPAPPPSIHPHWHTFVRLYVAAGTYACNVCGKRNELIRYHCQYCPDYDECDSCRRNPHAFPGIPSPAPVLSAPVNPEDPPPYSLLPPTPLTTSNPSSPTSNSSAGQQVPGPAAPSRPSTQLENIARIVSSVVGLENLVNNNGVSQA